MAGHYRFDTRRGEVVAFDDHAGLGEVADLEGGRWPFHCTRIADGTRTIDLHARVRFAVVAGPGGRWEASQIEPDIGGDRYPA